MKKQHYMTEQERHQLEAMRRNKIPVREIARQLGFCVDAFADPMPEHPRRQPLPGVVLPQLQRLGERQRGEPQPDDPPFLPQRHGLLQDQQKEDSCRPGLDEQLSSEGAGMADTKRSSIVIPSGTPFQGDHGGSGYRRACSMDAAKRA